MKAAAASTTALPWTLYVADASSQSVIPVDTATNTAGSPIATPAGAFAIAITPNASTAYVAGGLSSSSVTPIDLATNTAGTPISVGNGPANIAINPTGTTALVGDFGINAVTPIDLATNTARAPIAINDIPGSIAITPDGKTAYVGTLGGPDVIPIDLTTDTAGSPIPLPGGAFSIAITPDGKTAYVACSSSGPTPVVPIDVATNTAGPTIDAGTGVPGGIAITPDGSHAYVSNIDSGTVTPIDLATNTAESPIVMGASGGNGVLPDDMAITPDGSTAYVAEEGTNSMAPIDLSTNTVGSAITLGPASGGSGLGASGVAGITPDQAPVANLTASPAQASATIALAAARLSSTVTTAPGGSVQFDASASTVQFGTIASYAWNFGDGTTETTTTPTVTHAYSSSGTYTASVTETSSGGTSTAQVFTGRTMSRNGGPQAVATTTVQVSGSTNSAEVLLPSNGATLSGTPAILDGAATNPSSVTTFQYELTGGSYTNKVVATAKPSFFGWLAQEANGTWGWDSTSVPSGAYTLNAVVTYNDGTVVTSPGVSVTVSNPVPTAQVLVPADGATVSGTTSFDATASYWANIAQLTYFLDGVPIGNATPTIFGWVLFNWDTTAVANGSHTLTVVATYNDGASATSPGITVTVANP